MQVKLGQPFLETGREVARGAVFLYEIRTAKAGDCR